MLAYKGFSEYFTAGRQAVLDSKVMTQTADDEIIKAGRAMNPGAVLAIGTRALDFCIEQFPEKKIIYCMVIDAKAREGVDIAGKRLVMPEDYRVSKIKEVLPGITILGTVYTKESYKQFAAFEAACAKNGLSIIGVDISDANDFPRALNRIKNKIGLYVMLADSALYYPESIKYLLMEGYANGMPVMGLSSFYTKAGALIAVDFDYYEGG